MRCAFIDCVVLTVMGVMLGSHLRLLAEDVRPAEDSPVHLAPVEGKKNKHKHDHVEPEPLPEPDPLIDVKPEPIPPKPRPQPDRNTNRVKPLPDAADVVIPIKPVKPVKPGLLSFVGTWLWRLVLAILAGAFLCGVGLTLAGRRYLFR